jgi:hypothetical protein
VSWSALIGVLPAERANRDRCTAPSYALVGARWCPSCCTTVVRGSSLAAAPRSSFVVGASRGRDAGGDPACGVAVRHVTAAFTCRPALGACT